MNRTTAQTPEIGNLTPAPSRVLQRVCACGQHKSGGGTCSACAEERLSLQRSTLNDGAERRRTAQVPPIVDEVLRSPGQPLDAEIRSFFEARFNHDFSRVRVHTDGRAAASAEAVGAHAYTVNHNVVFGSGQYAPATVAGKKLLAHELTHVTQQRAATPYLSRQTLTISSEGDAHEREADAVATRIMSGETTAGPPRFETSNTISRDEDGRPGCTVSPGITNSTCRAYLLNSWWLPNAYVNNATCACLETPNVPTAKCVRKFLQARLAATPASLKALAAGQKWMEIADPPAYQMFVQSFLTPLIYIDHVMAYAACCCPSGPAPYPSWVGVTTVPMPCPLVGAAIRHFGSCHGTPGTW